MGSLEGRRLEVHPHVWSEVHPHPVIFTHAQVFLPYMGKDFGMERWLALQREAAQTATIRIRGREQEPRGQ